MVLYSPAGGVKTTTFSVTVAALWATIRGDDDTAIFRRRLPDTLVAQAFFICLISFLALNAVALLLMILEPYEILKVLFESASAFGTVGLSVGHPGSVLSLSGHMADGAKLPVWVGRAPSGVTAAGADALAAPPPCWRVPCSRPTSPCASSPGE